MPGVHKNFSGRPKSGAPLSRPDSRLKN